MKAFIISLMLLNSSVSFASELAKKICPDDPNAKLLSDWKKNSKDEYCAKASCTDEKGPLEREKCFSRSKSAAGENVITVGTDEFRSNSYHGIAHRVILNAEDPCFDSCKPKKGSFNKVHSGLNRKECVACFKERVFMPAEGDLTYPELGRIVPKGSKCYYACKDKEGPIVEKRVLPETCQPCLNETFEYLKNQNGKCYEVDSLKKIFSVDKSYCENKNGVHRTTFTRLRSITQMFSGGKGTCYEVDIKTFGQIYKMTTGSSNCDSEAVDNSDRSIISDKDSASPAQKPKKSSASGQ